MKFTKNILYLVLLLLIINACSQQKRFTTIDNDIKWKGHNTNIKEGLNKIDINEPINAKLESENFVQEQIQQPSNSIEEPIIASIDNSEIPNFHLNTKIKSSNTPPDECDDILLRTGEEIKAKVLEVQEEVIKYKRCDNLNGPIYTIKKSDVFMIKYFNGTKEIIQQSTAEVKSNSKTKKTINQRSESKSYNDDEGEDQKGSGFGIASLICGVIGLFVLPVVFGPLGIIFGIIGLGKGRQLKGLAIAGLIIGIINLGFAVYVLAKVL